MRILDIGCGQNKTPGAIGVDVNPVTQADVLADVERTALPFADDAFDKVVCRHIVEHVADMVAFLEEVHRVSKPGSVVQIVTPHFSNRYSFTDPTHVRHLAWRSLDYFSGEPFYSSLLSRLFETRHPIPGFYSRSHFRIRRRFLDFGRIHRWLGIQALANRFPDFYEHYLTFLFPARDLHFELEVVK